MPGVVAGLVCFAFSRVLIEPLIGAAVDYEAAREDAESDLAGAAHEHGHELFTRSIQENVGAAVGVIAFAVSMGVLFAVAYTVLRAVLARRGFRPDGTGMALLLAAGMCATVAVVPGLKYPANPPTVGLPDTIGARSSAFLTMTVLSVLAACAAVAVALVLSRRWGGWRASAIGFAGYIVAMVTAAVLLPGFHEVPGPLTGAGGLVLNGFPAETLAEFRVYSMLDHAVMWFAIGVCWAALAASSRRAAREPATASVPPERAVLR
jgi:hypothetical protein